MTKLLRTFLKAAGIALGLALPAFAFAQSTQTTVGLTLDRFTQIAVEILNFINMPLVPLIFAVAFIVFLFNVFKRFFLAKDSSEIRKESGQFVFWGIIGFVVMVSVWGIVNLLVYTLNFDNATRPCIPAFGGDGSCTERVPTQ